MEMKYMLDHKIPSNPLPLLTIVTLALDTSVIQSDTLAVLAANDTVPIALPTSITPILPEIGKVSIVTPAALHNPPILISDEVDFNVSIDNNNNPIVQGSYSPNRELSLIGTGRPYSKQHIIKLPSRELALSSIPRHPIKKKLRPPINAYT
ncbi:hypothetical protein CONCODRAFT_13072 [Conidiobolus coronatus NRRL 28638]|uniref:Uncharacterized protein n=1 Tax=Conidiobolus coronatus (strain ATCC 28846 / CBS 209.66 / NRRL 28638) TaxID=796925 RepID=A0A137NRF8_CONC2|nr:hypothetical protein CONCODRAFT_13072 [Conidiobolus coronatus NRRL 28638]|eukprot:KXN65356.1 hypothetical protein CONCODRAFT_13072 [Conidiobolus coronatus NRRL 28638]